MQLGRSYIARWPCISAAQALATTGQVDLATAKLAAHDALELPMVLLNETDLLRARAWTTAAAGDLPAARHHLEVAADLGEEIGDVLGATNALHSLARLGHARQVAGRLAQLATRVDGPLVAARASYASAVAARDSNLLEKVSQDFEDLGTILYTAEVGRRFQVMTGGGKVAGGRRGQLGGGLSR